MSEARAASSAARTASSSEDEGVVPRIIPLDDEVVDRGSRPFAVSAAKKCYVIFDKGPPPVLTEVDCGDIVIVDQKLKFV